MPKREPALSKLGQNIRSRRESLKLSQEDLADKADLDRTYIGGVERGERNPTILSTLRISKALGLSLSEITKEVAS